MNAIRSFGVVFLLGACICLHLPAAAQKSSGAAQKQSDSATAAPPARVLWGCQATDSSRYNWFAWGAADEQEARAYTIKTLCEPAHHGGCRIVECRAGVGTQAEAEKLWSNGQKKVRCLGTAKC